MKVFVSGGTGVAGSGVVPALVAAGHDVTAATRSDTKADLARAWGAEPVAVDLFDRAATMAAVVGHDAICNLATHIPPASRTAWPGAWRQNDRIRRLVSANLVDAALATDTARFVQESIGFLYPDRGDEWIDEDVEIDPIPVTETALEAEAQAARFTATGRTGVVMRFAAFYGPDAGHSVDMVRMAARWGVAPTIGDPHGFVSSIHRDDVGTAVVAALGAPAGTYNVGDDEPMRRSELHAVFAEALGRRRLREAGRLIARIGGRKAEAVARSQRLSNAKFKAATGWSPSVRSARDGWPPIIQAQVGT